MARKSGLVQGTLDMLVLRLLSREKLHGLGIARRLEHLSRQALQVEEGSLYPALYRMEDKGWLKSEWAVSEKGQRAKYYSLTRAGQKQLETEKAEWRRMAGIIADVMGSA